MDELGIGKRRPTVVYQDNQACIKIANGEGHYEASKHFIIRYFALSDNIKLGHLVLVYQGSENLIADILTKALERSAFERHCYKMIQECYVGPE